MTISVVLYGRNDSYGYNLHKRAALSLNCMAEVLTNPSDEIIFVDYNTPDDFPTFPEAIQDTLTERAKKILRILRVRPIIHQRFRSKTHLVALEPIARNVAVRRSSSANRWILSTNTDMIFVPRDARSLSEKVQELPPGFYHAPRIEIPEVLWESLDRNRPAEIIATVRDWGRALHLNEIVLGSEFILYDGPGDFQLLLRSDLFENHGFHEEMLMGWHVDSNIAKRMHLKYGKVGDLGGEVFGYHCDHTRQVTPAHSHTRLQNDWKRFCDEVDKADIPEQADIWGCFDDAIEEVRLVGSPASVYVEALREAIGEPLTEPHVTKYTHDTFNRSDYDPRHMVPFLADMFASMPRNTSILWYGAGGDMLSRFARVWRQLGFSGRIMVDVELVRQDDLPEPIELIGGSDGLNRADAYVFDFGGLPGADRDQSRNKRIIAQLFRHFLSVVREERRRISAGLPGRRVIALNAINNQFERLVAGCVAAATTPCATHMRHGFVLPAKAKDDWLPLLQAGRAGVHLGDHIESDPRKLGVVALGPYKYLEAGRYRLSIKIQLTSADYSGGEPCVFVVVTAGPEVLGSYLLRRSDLENAEHEFLFVVPKTNILLVGSVEARIVVLRHASLNIRAVSVESLPSPYWPPEATAVLSPIAFGVDDWLPYLTLGPLGRANDTGVSAERGPADFVVFGPYWPLPVGKYELVVQLSSDAETPFLKDMIVKTDVTSSDEQLVAANFRLDPENADVTIRLPFEMEGSSSEWQHVETRIWSSGEGRFRITSLSVRPLEQASERDLLPFVLLGDAGQRIHNGFINIPDRAGVVAYSPCIRLQPGIYQITFAVEAGEKCRVNRDSVACAFVLVKYEDDVLEAAEATLTESLIRDQEIVVVVPPAQGHGSGLELFFHSVCGDIALRKLTLGPRGVRPPQQLPAILRLRDWLPFLQRGKLAHSAGSGIEVSEGAEEFALYGPFWSLPAGRYEMRASVVPNPLGRDHNAVVTAQIAGQQGTRVFAQSKWHLGHHKLTDPTMEFRLPFELGQELSRAERMIETRVFTPGSTTFRILSISVVAKSEDPERNWFPYLTVTDCGIHMGTEIRTVKDRVGYVAVTPPMLILPGRYRLVLDLSSEALSRDRAALSFELWCGSELFAIIGEGLKGDALEFDVPCEFSGRAVELRIRTLAEVEVSIRSLVIDKVSDAIIDLIWRRQLARAQFQRRRTQLRLQMRQGDLASLAKLSRSAAKSIIGRIRRN